MYPAVTPIIMAPFYDARARQKDVYRHTPPLTNVFSIARARQRQLPLRWVSKET